MPWLQRRWIVGEKPVITFVAEKINHSGISPANRSRSGLNSVYVDMSRGDNVQGMLGAICPFWENSGWDESRGARVFLCGNPEELSATSQRPMFTKFGHET